MNKKIKLKTTFDFDSAHRLVGYNGKCNNCHGHIWKVNLTIDGYSKQLDKVGILWDFTNVKKLKDMFDHKTILKDCEENSDLISALEKTCGKDSVYLMKQNPTAEYLVDEILGHCKNSKPSLDYTVEIYESPKSSATGSTIKEGEENA